MQHKYVGRGGKNRPFHSRDFHCLPGNTGREFDCVEIDVTGFRGRLKLVLECAETGCCAEERGWFGRDELQRVEGVFEGAAWACVVGDRVGC